MKRAPAAPAAVTAAAVVSSTPLSAAALQLAAAVHGKAGLAAVAPSPGSECGHSTCSSLISAVVRGHEIESDSDRESVSDIEEESEGYDDEGEQKCDLQVIPADAGFVICSNSSIQNLKEKEAAEAAAGVVAAAAGLSLGSSSNSSGVETDGSNQQPDESSSSSAGAGGPSDAAAGSA